jgi:tetratricopeptide (TPR) repeat protein
VLCQLGRFEDALSPIRQMIALNPYDRWARCQLAFCFHRLNRLEEGVRAAEEAIRVAPEYDWPHRLRGVMLAQRGDYSEAARSLREAARLNPDSYLVWQAFNWLVPRPEYEAEVLAAAQEAVRLSPDDTWAWFALGRAHQQTDRRAAVDAYRKCLSLDPENSTAHNNLGWIYLNLGELDQAERSFKRSLEIAPAGRVARNSMYGVARLARLRGDVERADAMDRTRFEEDVQRFEHSLQELPDDSPARDKLVYALWGSGRRAEAWETLRDALRRDSESKELWETMGAIAPDVGRLRLARYACRRVLAVEPDNSFALRSLATAQLLGGQVDELESTAERLAEVAPGSAPAARTLGDVELARGRWDEARKHYEEASALAPLNSCYVVRIGIAQARAGDADAAAETWRRRERLMTLRCGCALLRVFADLLGKELPA